MLRIVIVVALATIINWPALAETTQSHDPFDWRTQIMPALAILFTAVTLWLSRWDKYKERKAAKQEKLPYVDLELDARTIGGRYGFMVTVRNRAEVKLRVVSIEAIGRFELTWDEDNGEKAPSKKITLDHLPIQTGNADYFEGEMTPEFPAIITSNEATMRVEVEFLEGEPRKEFLTVTRPLPR